MGKRGIPRACAEYKYRFKTEFPKEAVYVNAYVNARKTYGLPYISSFKLQNCSELVE